MSMRNAASIKAPGDLLCTEMCSWHTYYDESIMCDPNQIIVSRVMK